MSLYSAAVILHLLAAMLWLGHMFVWSLIAGPALKRVAPPATAELLRERSLHLGALGWPALAVLIPTGLYLLHIRGVGLGDVLRLDVPDAAGGSALLVKLLLVVWMVAYQAVWGHRRATVAIYANMAAALLVLLMSVVITRGWS
jgi:uncharacterized membrane protein